MVPPKPPKPPEPFGLYLADLVRQPYRIQIQGYSGDRNKPQECVLFFFDEERQVRFFIRPGQKNAEAKVEVLDFAIKKEIDEDSMIQVIAIATIKDQRSGETIKLIDGERLYEDEITVVLRSDEDPGILVERSIKELPEEGIPFKTSLGQYILKEISLEEQTITVEKQASEESEAETLTLSSRSKITTESTHPENEKTEASIEESDEAVDFGDIF